MNAQRQVATIRRLHVLQRILHGRREAIIPSNHRLTMELGRHLCSSGSSVAGSCGNNSTSDSNDVVATTVSIDGVTKVLRKPVNVEFVPHNYLNIRADGTVDVPQTTMHHLRWMLQKDCLGQDMFLIGRPGTARRHIAMQYLQLTQREVEYVSLSRDTTESDLKQRREITAGTATYIDQAAVRAAVHGRILIVDGVEKAERNVLPILNNLLENREMNLEDGRLLIPAARYDTLLERHRVTDLRLWGLVRVSPDFRVIALGLPVPKYVGSPLDPPLRSRFQAREIGPQAYQVTAQRKRVYAY